MTGPQETMEVGLTRKEVISRLGEPDRVKVLKNSFRPRDDGEGKDDYQEALKQWEKETVGEIWIYEKIELTVRISKAGKVVNWDKDRIKSRLSTTSGLVKIEPGTDEPFDTKKTYR